MFERRLIFGFIFYNRNIHWSPGEIIGHFFKKSYIFVSFIFLKVEILTDPIPNTCTFFIHVLIFEKSFPNSEQQKTFYMGISDSYVSSTENSLQ